MDYDAIIAKWVREQAEKYDSPLDADLSALCRAVEEAVRGAWSPDPPTEEGWWWHAVDYRPQGGGCFPEPVRVRHEFTPDYKDGGQLVFDSNIGTTAVDAAEKGYGAPVMWCPIPEPPPKEGPPAPSPPEDSDGK
jgi:hypothetical protein